MTDDLQVFLSARDEQRARVAGVLSVTAIVMLLVTSFTLARGPINAAPTVATTGEAQAGLIDNVAIRAAPLLGQSVAAPFDCPRLQGRQWLRLAVCQQGDLTLAGCECVYGYANSERFEQ